MKQQTGERPDGASAPVVSLITPMFNESDRIESNLKGVVEALKNLGVSWEYILVDDGSTDDSLEKARRAIKYEPNCRVIHYDSNRGRGYALRQGFAAARGEFVVATESDFSWGFSIVGKILSALKETKADIVIASVHLPGGGMENVPLFRSLLSKFGNSVTKRAFGNNLTMITGMTRGYRRDAIKSLRLEENSKEIHLEIVAKALALGYRIVEIPATISWAPPGEGGKARGGFGILKFVTSHLFISFQRASVRMMSWLAAFFAAVGVLTVVVGALHKIYRFLPFPLPNLVIYGLIICVIAFLIFFFLVLSIQLEYLYKSVVHIQSQLAVLERKLDASPNDRPPAERKD